MINRARGDGETEPALRDIRPASPTLNPLAISVLALLVEREMHPYEMYQLMLLRREDRVVKVSAGSLYRAVERLARDGLISEAGVEREGNRPERTRYAITDAGRDALLASVARMLRAYVNEYPEFPLAVGEAHNLPADEVVALLEERRASVADWIASIDASLEIVAAKDVPRRFVLHVHYSRTMLAAEDRWLADTIAELNGGALDWSPGDR